MYSYIHIMNYDSSVIFQDELDNDAFFFWSLVELKCDWSIKIDTLSVTRIVEFFTKFGHSDWSTCIYDDDWYKLFLDIKTGTNVQLHKICYFWPLTSYSVRLLPKICSKGIL